MSWNPWTDLPEKTTDNVRTIVHAISEVTFVLREARRKMAYAHPYLSHDDVTALQERFTYIDAKDLCAQILDFALKFHETLGLNLEVMSWKDFFDQMTKAEARIRELQTLIDDKTEQVKHAHLLWTDYVAKSIEEQKMAKATENDLRERIAHLECALAYAAAQVSERR